jgi:hypothetical protein
MGIARDSICDQMHDQGSWVRDMCEGLDNPAKSKVVHEIGLFALTIIVERSVVQAERGRDAQKSLQSKSYCFECMITAKDNDSRSVRRLSCSYLTTEKSDSTAHMFGKAVASHPQN